MPAIQKRTMTNAIEMPAKKTKVVEDPVMAKVAVIAAALESDKFVVPGTNANREMLVAMAPAVLATPVDERHAHQQTVADTFKEIFATEEARLAQRVEHAKAKVTEASVELSAHKEKSSSAECALKEKSEELKAKLAMLASEVGVTRESELTLKELTSELTDLEQMQSFTVEDQQETANLKTEHFNLLMEGTWEEDSVPKDHVKALTSFFKKIKVDASMVAALPMALGRKPAERSEFDSMAASELSLKLEARLLQLAQSIESNTSAIAAKKTQRDAADAALIAARTQQRLSTEALLELKAEQKQRISEHSEKHQAVVEQEFSVKAVDADLYEEKSGLELHQKVLSDLTELLERIAPVPEVVAEEEAAEKVTEPIAEAIEVVPEPIQEPVM